MLLKLFRRFINRSLLALISLMLTMLIILSLVYLYMQLQLPNVSVLKDIRSQEPMRVYTRDNKLIAQFGAKYSIPVKLEEVPQDLINAVLATEDSRYYSHPGVDLVSLFRAAKAVMASGDKVQGASTITMQVARNFFLTRKKTYSRKVKEVLLAIKIEQSFSKEKILELYLNKVYFGKRAYGVAAAAQVYYGKSLNTLTLSEMATLAGLPQAPSRNNPLSNPEKALERRNHVLNRMLEVEAINESLYKKAIAEPLTAKYHGQAIQVSAPYVAEMVRQVLFATYGEAAYEQGFHVTTTVSSTLQQYANDALKKGLSAYNQRHGYHHSTQGVQGALVSMDPQDGAILALVGGLDYSTSRFNRAIQAERQPGSNFKPFLYSAALEKGMTLATIINDAPIVIADSSGEDKFWRPHNDTNKFYGPTRLRDGLIHSRNLVSIRILSSIGIPYLLDYIGKFGIDPAQLPSSLSLALGSGVLTPLQVANGYAVLANGGFLVHPYFIQQIQRNNVIDYSANPKLACPACIADPTTPQKDRPQPTAVQTLSPQNAYLMTQALQDVIQKGTGGGAKILKRNDLAGKTGTTNDQMDAWFSGFNSHMVTTVWVGFDTLKSLHEYGAQAALPIWTQYMQHALSGVSEAAMPIPPGIVTIKIDPATGLLARPSQKDALFEMFTQNSVPKLTASGTNSDGSRSSGDANGGGNEPLF